MSSQSQRMVTELFQKAGITINGQRPFDIRVHNEQFYRRVLQSGQLGIGESYMDGWWDCDNIPEMTNRFLRADLLKDTSRNLRFLLNLIWVRLTDIGSISRAFEVGKKHYDLGNDLFEKMLDPNMIYSCAYWKDAETLEAAQLQKLDLICRKIKLEPGMKVLEIGCGWGGWAKYAATNYGVEVTGLTVSAEQAKYARDFCKGLPVEILLKDYREAKGQYDRVVSIAMFEAVGQKYFRTFMEVAARCLKPDGLFFLHTITANRHLGPAESTWMNKYIFPNGELPTLSQIAKSAEGLFIDEAHHQLSGDYEKTLRAWYENFMANLPLISKDYDERFIRMWSFYLLISQGICRSRLIHLWQFVFSKDGIPGNMHSFIGNLKQDMESR